MTADEARSAMTELQRRAKYPFKVYFLEDGPRRRALYPKHLEFFAAGATFKERLFMAANRVGKSDGGAYELTCHLTGQYPAWWTGRRFEEPIEAWACGTTSESTRDTVQAKLCGSLDIPNAQSHEDGMLPAHLILHKTKRTHGLSGALESIWVKHVSGKPSVVGLKMYEQGRTSFEGTGKHVLWCDEEPPLDCYTEMLYRTMTTHGIVLTTFTPLQGMSDVVKGFLAPEQPDARLYKTVIQAGWDDVPHLDAAEKAALLATTPPFQREARTKGLPQLGAGAIYQLPESDLSISPFEIPLHWPRCYGMDTDAGAGTTAVVWLALDRETQTIYVYDVYKKQHSEPAVHVEAIKRRGPLPGVADAAALLVTAHDAEQLIALYKRAGLDVELPDKAVEAGIQEVWEAMSTGRFKVFSSCDAWFKEYRLYHRDEKGRIVKANDHVMDATRYAVRSGLARATSKMKATETRRKPTRYDPYTDTGGSLGGGSVVPGWGA